jgi:hypothetical protein
MTRHRELTELRARCTGMLASMEMVAGSAPDFVRRFSGRGDGPDFSTVYNGLRDLLDLAAKEAREVRS